MANIAILPTSHFSLASCLMNMTRLCRGLMTGITRISKESIFSDLNNIRVITTSSNAYADKFGFTDKEVSRALKEYGLNNEKDVRKWYDGFQFGDLSDIYNPWSILSYLQEKRLDTYWANTSSNGLVSKLIREGDKDHGFVLGLLVEMANDYCVKSNRESGFGRYDVVIEPYDKSKNAFILEFKVRAPEEEKSLEETVESAKRQIEDKVYKAELIDNGVLEERIFSYGFAFEGKKVLIL